MPLQNRVLPNGEIVATPERGTFMGNRGILHDDHRHLGARRWQHQHWVTCRLAFKGRHRDVMSAHHYTELFFLDEAVALAAGHRPCAECRRGDYLQFVEAWNTGNPPVHKASALDAALHSARVTRSRAHVTHTAACESLPDGAFVALDGAPWLVHRGALRRYTPGGYTTRLMRPTGPVTVLTPAPTVAVLAAGYATVLHPSVAQSQS